MYKVLHLCDQHISKLHGDPAARTLSLEALRRTKPDVLVLGGDLVDLYAMSTFTQKPEALTSLQREFLVARVYLEQCRHLMKNRPIYYTLGNHENRMEKRILTKMPGLASLGCLTIPSLLGCKKFKIKALPPGKPVKIGGLSFVHGSLIRKWGGQSAVAMLDSLNSSVAIGHSHRIGSSFVRRGSTVYECYESGCLCKLKPDYTERQANWQQGFSLFVWHGKPALKTPHVWVPVHLRGSNPLAVLKPYES